MELPFITNSLLLVASLPFLTCCLPDVAAHTGNETDRLALLALKAGITSDPLGSLRSWNSTLHFCQWQGVACGRRHQRVVVLDLQGRGLVGTISPQIGNLSFLRELRLRNNSFGHGIPEEIGHLRRLAFLDITNNWIGGSVPVSLSNCSRLAFVSLFGNQLVGSIPAELGTLPNLSWLGLGNNSLTGRIPPSLGNLSSSLTRLSIGSNNLVGSISDELGRLNNLGFFQVSGNNLSGPIPPSLYNLSAIYLFAAAGNNLVGSLPSNLGLTLPRLERLLLGVNQLSGLIPVSLTNASALNEIDLSPNNLRGSVPGNLGILTGLVRLNLGLNQLGSSKGDDLDFIKSLTNCSGLRVLGAQGNRLEGPLPSSIANFSTQLSAIALGGNMIYGSIPRGIGNLINLTLLAMEDNLLVGTIPSSMGNLRRLQVLALNGNRLSGNIPASLGNLSSLSQLLLQENGLVGDIPLSLAELRRLQLLNLSQNKLEGGIPRELFRPLSSLSMSVNLAHNSLSGPLPVEVGSLQGLGELVVSQNRLTGAIPATLGGSISLERLYMDGNSFEGGIPSSLSSLKGIQELDLSHNNLTGQIPAYLGSFQYLSYLNLSYNDLSGQVPKGGVFANASAISLLGNDHLCGGIPILKLPTCLPQASSDGGRKSHRIKLIILILCLVLFSTASVVIFFVLRMRKRSKRKPYPVSSSEEDQYRRVSRSELFRATNGFSSSNLLGVGSYGTVYKGQLDHDQAIVAVKVLNLQQSGASKSFLRECKALRCVRHRNLVKIVTLCSGVDHRGDDFKALVFEFMKNGSLDEWLHQTEEDRQHQQKSLNLLQRLNIAIDVASALDYLHQQGPSPIVHCDLKPSNVLLDDDMTARVGDFGLARFLSKGTSTDTSGVSISSTAGIKGTIGYIPPEYGTGGEASTKGDVYSYGILLLEMFTGRRPTDNIFTGNLNLHKFVESAFPQRIMGIVDPLLFMPEEGCTTINIAGSVESTCTDVGGMIEDRLVNIVCVGLSCCAELPQERPTMGDVMTELQGVRETLLKMANGRGINRETAENRGHHHHVVGNAGHALS